MNIGFFICRHCGNIVAFVKNTGVPIMCCGEKMEELVPNGTDASQEKHVPVVTQEGNHVTVQVGSASHPMEESHHIEWIFLHTKQGNQRKCLQPTDQPRAEFMLCDGDQVISALAYCNLHGLWKSKD